MTEHLIKDGDIKIFAESIIELFHETDKVTPKDVSERMTTKLNRFIHFNNANYLIYNFGFTTRIGNAGERHKRYIVRDNDLIDRLKSELLGGL